MPTLEFKGKPFVYAHHLSVPFRELVIDLDKSLPGDGGPSLDDNLIIHGDNLEALKALLPKYAGKVDCIFIDPPYNTGNEGWCYNDNVNSPLMKQWLGRAVDGEDLERHDKWACMMWPRLKLLWELLGTNGNIFVNIDSNEHASLKIMMDEIFGEDDFVGVITWESKTKSQNTSTSYDKMQPKTEFIYLYSKSVKKRFNLIELDKRDYPNSDERGNFRNFVMEEMNLESVRGRSTMVFEILGVSPRNGKQWQIGKDTVDRYIASGDVFIDKGKPVIKMRPEYERNEVTEPFWGHFDKQIGTAEGAKKELTQIIAGHGFDTVKPVALIERLVFHASNSDSLILDSFAGSGTTAHAVLAANAKYGGNRKFILIETEDYADTLTAERVRRVSKGYAFKGEQKTELMREKLNWPKLRKADDLLAKVASYDNLDGHKFDRIEKTVKDSELILNGITDCDETAPGLGGSFTYCELGEPMDMARFFDGAAPPAFDQVARYVAYTATGHTLDRVESGREDMFIGEAGGYRLHLLYRPDATFMRSDAAMLDAAMVDAIADSAKGSNKPILVFATGKYMGQKALSERGITFCQLPYAIHKMLPGDGAGD